MAYELDGLRTFDSQVWGEGLRTRPKQALPFGLGLRPEDKLETDLWTARLQLDEVRELLSTPGISPVQGAGKQIPVRPYF